MGSPTAAAAPDTVVSTAGSTAWAVGAVFWPAVGAAVRETVNAAAKTRNAAAKTRNAVNAAAGTRVVIRTVPRVASGTPDGAAATNAVNAARGARVVIGTSSPAPGRTA